MLVGTNNLLDGGTRHQVAEIFVHEDYNAGNWYINDIAVVRVADPFVYDTTTSPVVLPEQGQQSPGGSKGTLVGWGLAYVRKLKTFVTGLKIGNAQMISERWQHHERAARGRSGRLL